MMDPGERLPWTHRHLHHRSYAALRWIRLSVVTWTVTAQDLQHHSWLMNQRPRSLWVSSFQCIQYERNTMTVPCAFIICHLSPLHFFWQRNIHLKCNFKWKTFSGKTVARFHGAQTAKLNELTITMEWGFSS